MRLLYLILILLSGCVATPDWETGEGCWRTGVKETGVKRPVTDKIYIVGDKKLLEKCAPGWWGCYHPIPHEIYVSNRGGKITKIHEMCHSLGMPEHNNCYPNYAQWGKDEETACDWNGGEPNPVLTTYVPPWGDEFK